MKIKVIDIMNKIHNEENVPKQIKYDMKTYFYDEACQDYTDYDRTCGLFSDLLDKQYGIFSCLNDEVEIIEEEKKPVISKLYINNELQYDLEEKKIPEKLNKRYFLDNATLEQVDADLDFIIDKINEIIDYLYYLKSKGE